MLIKQIDHLHQELKESRDEQQQLRQKAQLHYTRRKEEWKKLKQFENTNNELNKQINQFKVKLSSINENKLNSLCISINQIIQKLRNSINNKKKNDDDVINKKSSYSL